MRRLLIPLFLIVGLSPLLAQAGIDAFPFKNHQDEQRFLKLTQELRCLVCQNESLAGSNADLAQDLRREIYEMIEAGKSNQEIITFLVNRYGDFVLYKPPVEPMTYMLWFGPLLLVLIGGVVLVLFARRRAAEARAATALSEEEQKRLNELLGGPEEKR